MKFKKICLSFKKNIFTPVCSLTLIRSKGEQINEESVDPINPEKNLI